ncbi:hypothetical protein VMCG_05233 [Cytospora schulzeri]|uniref:Heterokaryon incompatibility domain-containing protein n=1 Tax=Cytospora schulzeri TaxID=448051 RepID=A0A423WQS2_9PEZI|nr:hypothetical protein VMCG_05233 [Valsa malicola]
MESEAGPSHENTIPLANPSSASSVCAVCRGFAEEGHPRGRVFHDPCLEKYRHVYFHYPNLVLLTESARKGCQVCAFLHRAIECGPRFKTPDKWKPILNRRWAKAEDFERSREDAFDVGRDTIDVIRQMENAKDKLDYQGFLNILKTSASAGVRILLDDDKDWLREASSMAGIYSKSALTLAIHLCKNSSESFLQKLLLQQQSDDPIHSPDELPDGLSKPVSLSETTTRLKYTDKGTGEERILHLWMDPAYGTSRFLADGWDCVVYRYKRTSWLTRAWALQEWLLSPRVLHINDMTLWDCFEGYGNELEHRQMTINPLCRAPNLLGTDMSWYDIVEEFTRRKITNKTDRLPALAGLAEKYRRATKKEYIAGMWLEDLPTTLLWYSSRVRSLESLTAYRAPSWSWASLEGSVVFDLACRWPREMFKHKTSVISVHCEYYPPGTISTVTSGWIDLEGPIALVTGRRGKGLKIVPINGNPVEYGDMLRDQYTTCSEEDIAQSKIYLLKIVEDRTQHMMTALILQKVEEHSSGKDTFQRLGVAHRYNARPDGQGRWEHKTLRLI